MSQPNESIRAGLLHHYKETGQCNWCAGDWSGEGQCSICGAIAKPILSPEPTAKPTVEECMAVIDKMAMTIVSLKHGLRQAMEHFEAIRYLAVPVGDACLGCKETPHLRAVALDGISKLSSLLQDDNS